MERRREIEGLDSWEVEREAQGQGQRMRLGQGAKTAVEPGKGGGGHLGAQCRDGSWSQGKDEA